MDTLLATHSIQPHVSKFHFVTIWSALLFAECKIHPLDVFLAPLSTSILGVEAHDSGDFALPRISDGLW